MTEEKIEYKWLEAKLTGTDTVVFRLEDGAQVKIKVEIRRAGVATKLKNPDGTSPYHVDAGLSVQVIPSNRKFYLPKPPPKPSAEPKMKPI